MKTLLKKLGIALALIAILLIPFISKAEVNTNFWKKIGDDLYTNGSGAAGTNVIHVGGCVGCGGGSGGISGTGTTTHLPLINTVDGSNNILTLADSPITWDGTTILSDLRTISGGSFNFLGDALGYFSASVTSGTDYGNFSVASNYFSTQVSGGLGVSNLTVVPAGIVISAPGIAVDGVLTTIDNGFGSPIINSSEVTTTQLSVLGTTAQTGNAGKFLKTDGAGALSWDTATGSGITGVGTVNYFPRVATVDGSNNILTVQDGSASENDNYYIINKSDLLADNAGVNIGAQISGVSGGAFVTQTSISGGVYRNQMFYGDSSGQSYLEQRADGMELSMRDATSTINSSSIQMDGTSLSMYAQGVTPSDRFLYATGGSTTIGDVDGSDSATVLNISPSDSAGFLYNGALNATFGINKGANAFTADIYGTTFIAGAIFTGTGLNNLTSGGSFTGTVKTTDYVIEIDSTGIPDSVRISKNGVVIANNVAITGSAQSIADGVTFTFATTIGHTGGDKWTITAIPNGIYNTDNGAYYNNGKFLIGQSESLGNLQIGLQNGLALNDASINNVLIGQYSFQSATNISGIVSVGNSNGWNTINGSYDLIYLGHDNKFDDIDLHSGVVIGANVTGYSNTFVSGSDDFVIGDVFFGSGKVSTAPQATTIHGTGGDGADIGGADITIAGGISTGDQIGGSVLIATSANGGSGSAPNNLQQSVQFDGNGNIRASRLHNNITTQGNANNQDIRSGTYTPTVSGIVNLEATIVPHLASWMRVGNVVTVQWYVEITPSVADVYTSFEIDLPVPSNITDKGSITGSAVYQGNSHKNADVVQITADSASDLALFEFYPAVASTNGYSAHFSYLVEE